MAFVVVATANGAGYRYGVSDQAFYIPVVVRALDPAAYPRDSALIDAQGRLMLSDEVLAAVVRTTGWHLDAVFLAAYLLTAGVLCAGLMLVGSRVYQYQWTSWALLAALTLRHRITRTSANSIEPYYHPRTLAFGVGLLAVAALLGRRSWLAVALVATAAAIHVTSGLWFMVLVGTALVGTGPVVAEGGRSGRRGRRAGRRLAAAVGSPAGPVHDNGRGLAAGGGHQGLALRVAVAAVRLGREPRPGGRAVGGARGTAPRRPCHTAGRGARLGSHGAGGAVSRHPAPRIAPAWRSSCSCRSLVSSG